MISLNGFTDELEKIAMTVPEGSVGRVVDLLSRAAKKGWAYKRPAAVLATGYAGKGAVEDWQRGRQLRKMQEQQYG
jgi:hypothetical protein